MYIEILCALVSHGPLKLAQLKGNVELDKPALVEVLNFLYEHCLVGEQNLDEAQKVYFVTKRGMSVLKVVAPLIKEAQKIQMQNYEITSNALSTINSGTKKQKRIAVYSKKRLFHQRTLKM
jgi:DNA-binding HxlR family transcriptional regulator